MVADSILDLTKNALGIVDTYDVFDMQIIMHINSVFSTLHQLGVGPTGDQFEIEDDSQTWAMFLEAAGTVKNIKAVKTYMYLKVRMLFDPPSTSYHIDAMKEQIQEQEWRISVVREGEQWQDPTPPTEPENS